MSEDTDRRLLTRIILRDYKSIGACDVRPAQLSFLVGPNGSGKSNFLDGLRFSLGGSATACPVANPTVRPSTSRR
jgi:recombinational DNA repair ATPase RecF